MKKSKTPIIFAIVFLIGFFIMLAAYLFVNSKIKEQEETIKKHEDLLQIHEGNTFNLRDDIAVLQDSLRLIRVGEIKIDTDTTNDGSN